MTAEHSTTIERGIPRRTLLKATAWSVPVVAAATAVPAYAASGDPAIDVMSAGGVGSQWLNSTKTRYASMELMGLQVQVSGTDAVPAGSILALSWDNRISPDLAPYVGSTPLTRPDALTVSGNRTSGIYLLPEIPATADPAGRLEVQIAYFPTRPDDPAAWYPDQEDLEPYTFAVTAPAGSSATPDQGSQSATYTDTHDLAFTDSTWRGVPVDVNGTTETAWIVEGVTIRSLGPGPAPANARIIITLPPELASDGALTGFQTTIDGIAHPLSLIAFDAASYGFQLDEPLAAGSVLVASWTTTIPVSPVAPTGAGTGGARYNSIFSDRDLSNNSAVRV